MEWASKYMWRMIALQIPLQMPGRWVRSVTTTSAYLSIHPCWCLTTSLSLNSTCVSSPSAVSLQCRDTTVYWILTVHIYSVQYTKSSQGRLDTTTTVFWGFRVQILQYVFSIQNLYSEEILHCTVYSVQNPYSEAVQMYLVRFLSVSLQLDAFFISL